jgi:hypothetical protein
MKYVLKSNLKHDGVDYLKGQEIELDNAIAQSLLKDGVIGNISEIKDNNETEEVQPAVNDVVRTGEDVKGKIEVKPGEKTEIIPEEEAGEADAEKAEDKTAPAGDNNETEDAGDNL